ncbi:MAG: energy transducer TonB [Azoarcus sp.]|jgi:protein TonB|nr:energy transducer TonB [Azoarcus sp.]
MAGIPVSTLLTPRPDAPLAVRGFLFALVTLLHVVAALAMMAAGASVAVDSAPAVLQASWIAPGAPEASAPAPEPIVAPPRRAEKKQKRTKTERKRVAEKRPAERPRSVVPAPQPTLLAHVPATESEPPGESAPAAVEPGDPNAKIDVGAAIKTAVAGMGGSGEGKGGGEDYVAPDFNANYLSNPEPEYPPVSRRMREQGLVKLRVHVTVDGRADDVKLYKSSRYARLDQAATEAVWRWRFKPARRAGIAVADWVVVPIRFELRS